MYAAPFALYTLAALRPIIESSARIYTRVIMSAAEIAGRVCGPTYLSGSWLGTEGATSLGAGACTPLSAVVPPDEQAPTSTIAVQPRANEGSLTSLHGRGHLIGRRTMTKPGQAT